MGAVPPYAGQEKRQLDLADIFMVVDVGSASTVAEDRCQLETEELEGSGWPLNPISGDPSSVPPAKPQRLKCLTTRIAILYM